METCANMETCDISNGRLTRIPGVGTISNMKAALLLDERHVVAENAFVELDDFWSEVDRWRF